MLHCLPTFSFQVKGGKDAGAGAEGLESRTVVWGGGAQFGAEEGSGFIRSGGGGKKGEAFLIQYVHQQDVGPVVQFLPEGEPGFPRLSAQGIHVRKLADTGDDGPHSVGVEGTTMTELKVLRAKADGGEEEGLLPVW